MNRREHIPYGYVAFTGVVLPDATVDRYNRIQSDINAFVDANRDPPDWLLNWSHAFFVTAASPQTT